MFYVLKYLQEFSQPQKNFLIPFPCGNLPLTYFFGNLLLFIEKMKIWVNCNRMLFSFSILKWTWSSHWFSSNFMSFCIRLPISCQDIELIWTPNGRNLSICQVYDVPKRGTLEHEWNPSSVLAAGYNEFSPHLASGLLMSWSTPPKWSKFYQARKTFCQMFLPFLPNVCALHRIASICFLSIDMYIIKMLLKDASRIYRYFPSFSFNLKKGKSSFAKCIFETTNLYHEEKCASGFFFLFSSNLPRGALHHSRSTHTNCVGPLWEFRIMPDNRIVS